MHCASLGEFEQGRPLLEKLKQQHPGLPIILTFFSPSGYEIRKNYQGADAVHYLPMDSPTHAAMLLDRFNPALVLWIKYDFWYFYLQEISKRKIPLLLVSAVFRNEQPFFKWYGSLWRQILLQFTKLFVQNDESEELIKKLHLHLNVSKSGDTRFDRVSSIAEAPKPVEGLKDFCNERKVIVAGSTWEEDEDEWLHYVNSHPQIVFIIAPHVVDREHISNLSSRFPKSITYSQLMTLPTLNQGHVLIIDNIGMLADLYQYADITYVGGGFGDNGLHNILEAAAYGKPVIIGPEYERHYEAAEMLEKGGLFLIRNALELERLLEELFTDEKKRLMAGIAAKEYVQNNKGATDRILEYIQENRLLIR
jgi:3-deoxy-D-manno-octulosonic-acid transferase